MRRIVRSNCAVNIACVALALLLSAGCMGVVPQKKLHRNVAPATEQAAAIETPHPQGLHDLSIVYGLVCALDTVGGLWCFLDYDESTSVAAVVRISGVPPLTVLRDVVSGICGIDHDQSLWCLGSDKKPMQVKTSGKVRHLSRRLAITSRGTDFITLTTSGFQAAPLVAKGVMQVIDVSNHGHGWLIRREEKTFVVPPLDNASAEAIETQLSAALPLPFLDGIDVTRAEIMDRLEGCAVTGEGSVLCWDRSGAPHKHAVSSGAIDVAWTTLSPFLHRYCVATESQTVCDDPLADDDDDDDIVPITISFQKPTELASSYDRHLCAIEGGTAIACLSMGLFQTDFRAVEVGEPVRKLTQSAGGACAVTQSGALVCWGKAFDSNIRMPTLELASRAPLTGPTTIIADGVTDFVLGDLGRSWCLSNTAGTVCGGGRWSGDVPVVDLDGKLEVVDDFYLCRSESGRVWCKKNKKGKLSPITITALEKPGVTALAVRNFLDTGCVARKTELRCWGTYFDENPVVTAPAPIIDIVMVSRGAIMLLDDGRVAYRYADSSLNKKPLTLVRNLRANFLSTDNEHSGWCAGTRAGLRCVTDVDGEIRVITMAEPRQGNSYKLHGCVLDKSGTVRCHGNTVRGFTGQSWLNNSITRLPFAQ